MAEISNVLEELRALVARVPHSNEGLLPCYKDCLRCALDALLPQLAEMSKSQWHPTVCGKGACLREPNHEGECGSWVKAEAARQPVVLNSRQRKDAKALVAELEALPVTTRDDLIRITVSQRIRVIEYLETAFHASAPARPRSWDDIKEREKLLDYMRVPLKWRNPARDAFDRHIAAVRKAADSDRDKLVRLVEFVHWYANTGYPPGFFPNLTEEWRKEQLPKVLAAFEASEAERGKS